MLNIEKWKFKANSATMSHQRLMVMIACFSLGFFTLIICLLSLIFSRYENLASRYNLYNEDNIPHRADIVDRNGILLATNLAVTSIYANTQHIIDAKEAAEKLSKVFPDLTYGKLYNDFTSGKKFIWVKRDLTPKELNEVNKLGLPGINFQKGEKRVYPHGNLFAHTLGFVGIDGNGMAGIEKYFDKELLTGNVKGKKQLKLALDSRVQNIVHEELSKAIESFDAIGGIGVVASAKTGEIIAMISLPDFDPHSPGKVRKEAMFNRASLGVYEMGSTFKTFTMAMALDSETVNLNDVFDVDKPIKAARFTISDYHAKGGWLSVPEIFMYSSNIGTAKIVMEMGKKKQIDFLRTFGMLDKIEIEIPEKATPIYPSQARWSDINAMTIAYGHGIAVTPLHVVQTLSALTNGGMMYPLTLVKIDEPKKNEGKKVVDVETSLKLRKLLRLVVEHGTGKKADIEGYLVGGKTGTANKNAAGSYSQNSRLSSFVASFPVNEPEYTILIMLDEPKGNSSTMGYATGGWVAAPVVGNIVSRMAPLYGITPQDKNAPDIRDQLYLEYKTDYGRDETF